MWGKIRENGEKVFGWKKMGKIDIKGKFDIKEICREKRKNRYLDFGGFFKCGENRGK